jgi:hypothetical protein
MLLQHGFSKYYATRMQKQKKLLETQNAAQMRLQGADLSEQSDQRMSSNGNSFLM